MTEDDYFVAPPGNIPLHELQVENNSVENNKQKAEKQYEISNSKNPKFEQIL